MRHFCMWVATGIVAVGVMAHATTAEAQIAPANSKAASDEGFTPGHVDVGPVIGLGALGPADLSFGGRFEFAFLQLPNFPDGILSIEAAIDHYSYSETINALGSNFDYGFTYTPIGATVNFHYRLKDYPKLDPFAGFGLGDYIVTTPSDCRFCSSYNSGIYPIARAGIRYFWQPNLALYADAGSGAGALHVGLMFKIK
jgi:hypothetical protein